MPNITEKLEARVASIYHQRACAPVGSAVPSNVYAGDLDFFESSHETACSPDCQTCKYHFRPRNQQCLDSLKYGDSLSNDAAKMLAASLAADTERDRLYV